MTVHQISIFVENKSGTLLKVLELFKDARIQLIASTISDTVEYGIYRIICSEPQRAYEVLKAAEGQIETSSGGGEYLYAGRLLSNRAIVCGGSGFREVRVFHRDTKLVGLKQHLKFNWLSVLHFHKQTSKEI